MLDVAEQDIDLVAAQGGCVAKTILMDFDFSWYILAIQTWPEVYVWELDRSTI